jgi:hypothetical protein
MERARHAANNSARGGGSPLYTPPGVDVVYPEFRQTSVGSAIEVADRRPEIRRTLSPLDQLEGAASNREAPGRTTLREPCRPDFDIPSDALAHSGVQRKAAR